MTDEHTPDEEAQDRRDEGAPVPTEGLFFAKASSAPATPPVEKTARAAAEEAFSAIVGDEGANEEERPATEPSAEEALAAFVRNGGDEGDADKGEREPTAEEALAAFVRQTAASEEEIEAARDQSEVKAAKARKKAQESEEHEEGEADKPGPLSDIKPDPDDGIKRRWYAIHAYSGQEGSVKKHLLVQAQQENLQDFISGVLIPMEEVAEIKSGEKKVSKRKFFPGYVLVRLPMHPERNPELWHLIKNTPGVSGFIGSRTVPVPLDEAEVKALIDEIRGESVRPKPKVKFEHGERVKIIDGPFSNFLGNIDEINPERGSLKVMVEIFERLTSVEVEFWQVEKV